MSKNSLINIIKFQITLIQCDLKIKSSESVANCGSYGHKAIKLVRRALRRNACTLCGGTAPHKLPSPTKDNAK